MTSIPLYLEPTSGFLLDFSHAAPPGHLEPQERELLKTLAGRVLELANQPGQERKRAEWYRHNALGAGRPLILLFPENAWEEILPESVLQVSDPFWRNQEWYLRHLLYRAEYFPDDFVIEPELAVPLRIRRSGWGLQGTVHRPDLDKGAYKVDPPIQQPDDIEKLVRPAISIDQAVTQREYAALGEEFGQILSVRIVCPTPHANLIGEAAALRGIDQLMLDMYDRPDWVHRLMAFITESVLGQLRFLEEGGHLTLNNYRHYNDAGGLGYSRELPAADWDGGRVRPCDMWGYGVAQELVLVGPAQHKEFLLDYQNRILEQFGLNAYGCCEPYTFKYDMLQAVPRLRRVSVSPWSDIEISAERLGSHCIFSWKPNPAMLVGGFDPEAIRKYIRKTLHAARNCVLEMILKDTYTVEYHPERLAIWARIAREEVESSRM